MDNFKIITTNYQFQNSRLIQSLTTNLILKPTLLLFKYFPTLIYLILLSLLLILQRPISHSFLLILLTSYLIIETIFHLLFLYRYHQLQHQLKLKHLLTPPIPKPNLRREIIDGLISSFKSSNQFTHSLTNWFYHIHQQQQQVVKLDQIYHQNLAELLASLIFSSSFQSLSTNLQDEIRKDIIKTQKAIHHQFKPGFNPHLGSYQHTLDPIQAQHRPLLFYLIINSLRSSLHLLLYLLGFRYHRIPLNQTQFSYWFHPGLSSSNQKPIILVAGIVGLISLPHYAISLLRKSRRPIFLVENPTVSLTLWKPELDLIRVDPEESEKLDASEASKPSYRRKIQTLDEQSICLKTMLEIHGFQPRSKDQNESRGAFLIGHSLGTCLTAHFVRHHPQYVLDTLSIDPISVLPYIPDLLRGFLYTEPKTVGQLLVRIISQEIGVATVIQRHFHWFEFVMFPHLDQSHSSLGVSNSHRHHFIISEHDALVNHHHLAPYLASAQPNCSFTSLQAAPHAGFLFFYFKPVLALTLSLLNRKPPLTSHHHSSSSSSSSSSVNTNLPRKDTLGSRKPHPPFFASILPKILHPSFFTPSSTSDPNPSSSSSSSSSSSNFNQHLSVYWILLFFLLLVGLPS